MILSLFLCNILGKEQKMNYKCLDCQTQLRGPIQEDLTARRNETRR